METVIGRKDEKKVLQEALRSNEPELVAVYGRRRVGKTYLIRQELQKQIILEFSGVGSATMDQQLQNFSLSLQTATKSVIPLSVPANWSIAFQMLINYADQFAKDKKVVIFFDEFPWISTQKSGFLPAFEFFWNSWASKHKNMMVVICGSAAAWMIQHIINNKGGLHNRITRKIRLLPFTLGETQAYLQYKGVKIGPYPLLQLYMVMGGVPHYLKEVRKGESAAQAIERICFHHDGLLRTEFKNLFHSLFDDPSRHMAIIKALAKNGAGLIRNEIIKAANLSSGGTVTQLLDELEQSGFITSWQPYERSVKETIFKLSDEYSHFYLKFIENSRAQSKFSWQKIAGTPSWRSWSGVAFERICLKHIDQLEKELGIATPTEVSAWRFQPKEGQGAQIDLIIDRGDFVINICEMKFSEKEFTIDKAYAANLQNKVTRFQEHTGTKKELHLTVVTTFGVKQNQYEEHLIARSVSMNYLFS